MTDIPEQLRAYVDAVAGPVTMEEIRARAAAPTDDHVVEHTPDRVGWRRRRPLLVAVAAALVLAMAGLVAVVRSAGDDSPTPIGPAGPHGRALRALSNESCADHLTSDGTVLLGAGLSNGQRVCVVQRSTRMDAFVDGRLGGTADVATSARPTVSFMLTGHAPSQTTLLTKVGTDVALLRATFCDGTAIDAVPFTGPTGARFTAIDTDVVHYGIPGQQVFDAAGSPLSGSSMATRPLDGARVAAGCTAPTLSDLAPTWRSTPITFDAPGVNSVTTLAANDQQVVVSATAAQSGNSVGLLASAPSLGAMTTTEFPTGLSGPETTLAYPGGFVTAGVVQPTSTDPTKPSPSFAMIQWSPDGTRWTTADAGAFTTAKHGGSYDTIIRGIAYHRGLLVAVGDVYTASPKRKQCCGLSPALWTSRDGVHWKRRIPDLGDEFDPYMESIVWFRGEWVATGRSGRFPLVVWRSRDLVHWDKTVVAQHAGGRVTVANDALYLSGGISGGTKKAPTSTPVMWRSTDAVHWQKVLTLPSATITTQVGIGPVYAAGDVLVSVATIPVDGSTTTTAVYESLDGKHWAHVPGQVISSDAYASASGLVDNQPTFVLSVGGTVTAWSAVPHPPTGKWAGQCSTLAAIRTRNETEPTAPDPTKGQAGLDRLAQDYQRLIREAPDARTRRLWHTIEPLFAHGATGAKPTITQRDAVAELDAVLATRCNESTGNVFKIVVQ